MRFISQYWRGHLGDGCCARWHCSYVPRRWRTFPVRRQKPAATFISLIASSYAGYRRNPKKWFYTDEAINYTIEINHPSFVRRRDKNRRCAGLTGMPPPVVCSDLSIKKAPTTVSNPLPFAASLFARKTLFSTFHKGFSKLVEPRFCDLKPPVRNDSITLTQWRFISSSPELSKYTLVESPVVS